MTFFKAGNSKYLSFYFWNTMRHNELFVTWCKSVCLCVNLRSEAKLIALIDCDDFYHQAGPIQTKRCCGRFTMNDMRNAVRVFTIIFFVVDRKYSN